MDPITSFANRNHNTHTQVDCFRCIRWTAVAYDLIDGDDERAHHNHNVRGLERCLSKQTHALVASFSLRHCMHCTVHIELLSLFIRYGSILYVREARAKWTICYATDVDNNNHNLICTNRLWILNLCLHILYAKIHIHLSCGALFFLFSSLQCEYVLFIMIMYFMIGNGMVWFDIAVFCLGNWPVLQRGCAE